MHPPVELLKYPLLQIQSDMEVPTVDSFVLEFVGQDRQPVLDVVPLTGAYVPVGQGTHCPQPSTALNFPLSHVLHFCGRFSSKVYPIRCNNFKYGENVVSTFVSLQKD